MDTFDPRANSENSKGSTDVTGGAGAPTPQRTTKTDSDNNPANLTNSSIKDSPTLPKTETSVPQKPPMRLVSFKDTNLVE